MAEPFLSEIRIFSFSFAPRSWAFCNGQLLPINQNQALFSLLGTTFGGNGQVNFALPNLQSRTPVHEGGGFTLGQQGGAQNHTLTLSEMPTHTHSLNAVNNVPATNTNLPANNFFGNSAPAEMYSSIPGMALTPQPATIANTGGSQAHLNMQPYLVLNFCIALQGIFPSQN